MTQANLSLIAEAGTVHHETGLSPRQLLEQRDELLGTLKVLSVLIWRDKEINACGLKPGEAIFVHAIEEAIAKIEVKND